MLNDIKSYLGIEKDAEFARYLGISPQTLSSWHSRNSFDIHLLYAKCIFLNAEWILTGKGEMLKSDADKKNILENVANEPIPSYDVNNWKAKYEDLQRKYTSLLEKHTQLLENKLKEVLTNKSAV